ncbi:MAG: methyltransferase domain-containing protein, partial [Syntrophobacteraceae bacterium]
LIDKAFIESLPGMTSMAERIFLYKYAAESYRGDGEIVDLGSWLGSLTIPLLQGLEENDRVPVNQKIVHAYDMFVWQQWMEPFKEMLQGNYKNGESFLPEFLRIIDPWNKKKMVNVCAGDLCRIGWCGKPIEMLVVDAMKSWELANYIIAEFYPHLIEGSYVFHQDFCHFYTYWVHLIHYRLRDSFELVADLPESGGVVFRVVRKFDPQLLLPVYGDSGFSDSEVEAAFDHSLLFVQDHKMIPTLYAAKAMAFCSRNDLRRAEEILDAAHSRGMALEGELKTVQERIFKARVAGLCLRRCSDINIAEHATAIPKRHNSNDLSSNVVSKAPKIAFGCISENDPKYLSQALRLIESLRLFGGSMADADFFLCVVDSLDDVYRHAFEKLGAKVRTVRRFSPKHPHSNKIRFFELTELGQYDFALCLDCDTVFVQDPSAYILGDAVRAKIADIPTVPHSVFIRLFEHFQIPLPPRIFRCTNSPFETIVHCNSGVILVPEGLRSKFVTAWSRYELELCDNLDLLEEHSSFCDQASMTLAIVGASVPFEPFPLAMNFPLHLPVEQVSSEMFQTDPIIIHYHGRVDRVGYLSKTPYPVAQQRVAELNHALAERRQSSFENRLFWDFRYSVAPKIGSGIGSRGRVRDYKATLLKGLLTKFAPKSILDLGCGDLAIIPELQSVDYVGVDISPVVIQENRTRAPWARFVAGTIQEVDLEPADLVLCLDVLIHQRLEQDYRNLVNRVVGLAGRWGLVSGFEVSQNPGDMIFYHEPLSLSLKKGGVTSMVQLGSYHDVVLFFFEACR